MKILCFNIMDYVQRHFNITKISNVNITLQSVLQIGNDSQTKMEPNIISNKVMNKFDISQKILKNYENKFKFITTEIHFFRTYI